MLRALRLAAILFTSFFVLLHITPLVPWYARALAGAWTDAEGDVLILLPAETQPDNLIGSASYWRSVYAIWAFRKGGFRKIVISGGGDGTENRSVAGITADFLHSQGIPRDIMILEERSTSTRENALFTKPIAEGLPGRKVLLTSDYHMFRAKRAFDKAGVVVTPRPIPDIGKKANVIQNRWQCFVVLLSETATIGWYYAKNWI